MKRVIKNPDAILCMSNIRGKYVKHPTALPFSFYFSSSDGVNHGPRVKPSFNPEKLKLSQTGTLKLCDDWKYVPGKEDSRVNSKQVEHMKDFFRAYLVLFCAVWDEVIQDGVVADYLLGSISFREMLQDFEFYEEYKTDLSRIRDVFELENFCRDNNLVNMYGN